MLSGMIERGATVFEELFASHAEQLFAFLVYRTGDRQLAEEVVADTFEKVLRTRVRFDPRRGSQKNWLYTIALNLARDHVRRQALERRALEHVGARDAGGSHYGSLEGIEDRDQLGRALATLGDAEREAIALRFGADLTVRETARILGEREAAVEKRISRALSRLRGELLPDE